MTAPNGSSGLRVTVEDLDTGEAETKDLPAGDYLIITTAPAYLDGRVHHKNGTAILTVKGRRGI